MNRFFHLVVVVGPDGEHGAEDFLLHRLEMGVGGLNDCRLHKVALALVALAAHDNPGVGSLLGVAEVGVDVVP